MMKKTTQVKQCSRYLVATAGIALIQLQPVYAASNTPGLFFFGAETGSADYSSADFIADNFQNEVAAQLSGISPAYNKDNTDSGVRITGGYQFNRYISAIFTFSDLGQYTFNGTGTSGTNIVSYDIKADTFGIELGGELAFPVMDNKLIPYANAGLFIWSSEAEWTVLSSISGEIHGSATDDGNDFVYGIGANYFLNEYVGVGVAWKRYDLNSIYGDNELKIDFLSLSFTFTPGS